MWSKAMAIRCFKSLKKTVSISCNSVNIQRDIISTFTPAVSISCLDFASLILVETSGDEKILLLAKFRCFTTDPRYDHMVPIRFDKNQRHIKQIHLFKKNKYNKL